MSNKIISFELKKKQYNGCPHVNVLVDENLAYIECAKCGKELNPIQYLAGLARSENSLELRIELLKKQAIKIDDRLRTKCTHCGEMTRI